MTMPETCSTVYSGTLTQEDLLNVESLLAGGQQLVWTIYNDDDQDTLEELKNAYEPLQVRDENLWIMTMESTEVLSLYQALWEELGGDLTTSDNRTGSIVLDLNKAKERIAKKRDTLFMYPKRRTR